jgi:ribosomal protein S27E
MVNAKCPVCDEQVDIGNKPRPETTIDCPYCGTTLVIKRTGRRWILEVFEGGEEEEEELEGGEEEEEDLF